MLRVTYRFHKRLPKWLHTVLGNLLKLPKAVAYHFHKRLHTTLGNLVRLDKLCNLGQSAPIAIGVEFLEPASREKITNLAPIARGVEFPDASKILSQFRARRKKSPTSLADIETILEILEVLTPEGRLGIMPP